MESALKMKIDRTGEYVAKVGHQWVPVTLTAHNAVDGTFDADGASDEGGACLPPHHNHRRSLCIQRAAAAFRRHI